MEQSVRLDNANRWSSFKHLNKLVNSAVLSGSNQVVGQLESHLRKHKPDFISLLKNPSPSPLHKEIVVQSVKDGITVVQNSSKSKKILPKNVVEEALLMSEMFGLNELTALELLVTGEHQVPRYPGAARGPVAVMLYYDAKRSLLLSLKQLLQVVSGRTWSANLNRDFNRLLTTFLTELLNDGVVDKALDCLNHFDVKNEFDLLHRNRALAPGKFKRQVYDMIKEIKELYAEIIFGFAAQFDLNIESIKKIIKYLADKSVLESNGSLDQISTLLMVGLWYAVDVSKLPKDGSPPDPKSIPFVVKNRTALKEIHQAVNSSTFFAPGLKTLINLSLCLVVRTLNSLNGNFEEITRNLDDEKIMEDCVNEKVFDLLNSYVARGTTFRDEEFVMLKIHHLITDIPHLFPLKLKELRDRGDEEGRIAASNILQGIQPPASLCHHFQKFLQLIADFYSEDSKGLSKVFWKASEPHFNEDEKYVSFHKFIRATLETYLPENLRLALFNMLTAFAKTSPFSIFGLLRTSGSLQNPQFSLDEIFKTFSLYYNSFHRVEDRPSDIFSLNSTMKLNSSKNQVLSVTAADVEVLCSILNLIESIVKNDKTCSISIAENPSYNCIALFIGLITCPVSRKLKSSLLSCLGGFSSSSPSVALSIWSQIDVILPKPQVAVIPRSGVAQKNWTDGVYVEIEDIEPRSEEYPVTIGFLKCMNGLLDHIICIQEQTKQALLDTTVNFIISGIFLKINSRIFAREEEKWAVQLDCLKIIHRIIHIYSPLEDEASVKPSFSVMMQILQENLFFRTIMSIVENTSCLLQPDSSSSMSSGCPVHLDKNLLSTQEKSLLLSLKIINEATTKQHDFTTLIRSIPGFPSASLMSMATLFSNINPRTSEADRLASLIKITSLNQPEIQLESVSILRGLVSEETSISHLCLLQIQPFKKYHEDYILHGFVDSLESEHKSLRLEVLRTLLELFQRDSSIGAYGLGHKILGFDRKLQLRAPGSFDQTFTCLHSIISTVDSEVEHLIAEERTLCMKIILAICTDSGTSGNSLRFLRTSYDMLANYLTINRPQLESLLLPETPWFWKILASEVKTVSDNSLNSHRNRYIQLLFGVDGTNKLLNLVPQEIFTHNHPEMPAWEYFDSNELWKTIGECAVSGLVDVKMLHNKMVSEIRQFSSQLGSGQSSSIQTEIKSILAFACQLNSSRENLNLKVSHFEGWRDMIETILLTQSLEAFSERTRGVLILQLIDELIAIASSNDTISSLINPISSTILIATTCARKMPRDVVSKSNLLTTCKSIVNLLESPTSADSWNQLKRARVNLYATFLHLIRFLDEEVDFQLTYRLLHRLIKDSLSEIELIKVLSISILAQCDTSWVNELSSDSSLRQLIESLNFDDKDLKANKCSSTAKSFYSFEAKMALLIKIASTQAGSRTLIHLGIVDVLCKLETFDLYPYSINEKEVCFKVFSSVLRLVLMLVDMSLQSDQEVLAKFLTVKSPILYDVMKTSPETYRNTIEGKEVILQITALVGKLVFYADAQLQKSFISFTSHCCDLKGEKDVQILTNVLQGCIKFMSQSPLTPLFIPSWDSRDCFAVLGQPSLGLLVVIIENSLKRLRVSSDSQSDTNSVLKILIESCLYVIWHHLNLFSSAIELSEEESAAISELQLKSGEFLHDSLLSGIQSTLQKNTFVDATIRRINRIINLGS